MTYHDRSQKTFVTVIFSSLMVKGHGNPILIVNELTEDIQGIVNILEIIQTSKYLNNEGQIYKAEEKFILFSFPETQAANDEEKTKLWPHLRMTLDHIF